VNRPERRGISRDETGRATIAGRGLSSYVNHALRQQLQHDRLAGLLAELEKEHRPIDTQVMEEVRQAWPEPPSS
jgi:hypothetical protein